MLASGTAEILIWPSTTTSSGPLVALITRTPEFGGAIGPSMADEQAAQAMAETTASLMRSVLMSVRPDGVDRVYSGSRRSVTGLGDNATGY
jgi:hypothetical protein